MSKILVTGGSGFIGSYLMKEIEADNIDLKEGKDVRDGIITTAYDVIIHLACQQANTKEAYQENWDMYKALDNYRIIYSTTQYIYISSAAVYNLNSYYALSKQLGEAYAKRFRHYTILRLSNVYGHGDGHGAPDRFMRGEKGITGNGLQVRDLIPVELVVSEIMEHMEDTDRAIYNVSSGVGTTVEQMFELWGKGKSKAIAGDIGTDESILIPGQVHG